MRYSARLEAKDGSGHFRFVKIFATSEAEARAALQANEFTRAGFRLSPEEKQEIALRVAGDNDPAAVEKSLFTLVQDSPFWRAVTSDDRSKITMHLQSQPYELAWIVEGNAPPAGPSKNKPATAAPGEEL